VRPHGCPVLSKCRCANDNSAWSIVASISSRRVSAVWRRPRSISTPTMFNMMRRQLCPRCSPSIEVLARRASSNERRAP